jgi:hypothetical protein
MSNIEFSSLAVTGHAQAALPNRFLRQTGESHALAVLLPGLNYSCDHPLLYYTTEILVAHSFDVLQLWANYTAVEFQALSNQDQVRWLVEDAAALVDAGLAQRNYRRLVLVGKSIGTLTLGALLSNSDAFLEAYTIWLTPLVHYTVVARGMSRVNKKSLCVAGSGDRSFDVNLIRNAPLYLSRQNLIIDGADHSLQIPGDLPRSLDAMKEIVAAVETFITSALAE